MNVDKLRMIVLCRNENELIKVIIELNLEFDFLIYIIILLVRYYRVNYYNFLVFVLVYNIIFYIYF